MLLREEMTGQLSFFFLRKSWLALVVLSMPRRLGRLHNVATLYKEEEEELESIAAPSKLELIVSFCAQRRVLCIYIMPPALSCKNQEWMSLRFSPSCVPSSLFLASLYTALALYCLWVCCQTFSAIYFCFF